MITIKISRNSLKPGPRPGLHREAEWVPGFFGREGRAFQSGHGKSFLPKTVDILEYPDFKILWI